MRNPLNRASRPLTITRLLEPLPSLQHLRRRLPLSVLSFIGSKQRSDSCNALFGFAALRLCGPACLFHRRAAGLPVLVHVVSRRAQGLRPHRVPFRRAILSPDADVEIPAAPPGRNHVVTAVKPAAVTMAAVRRSMKTRCGSGLKEDGQRIARHYNRRLRIACVGHHRNSGKPIITAHKYNPGETAC
jgi:hypothetical protein